MRVDLGTERGELGLGRKLGKFLLAKFLLVALERNPKNVDSPGRRKSDSIKRGDLIR